MVLSLAGGVAIPFSQSLQYSWLEGQHDTYYLHSRWLFTTCSFIGLPHNYFTGMWTVHWSFIHCSRHSIIHYWTQAFHSRFFLTTLDKNLEQKVCMVWRMYYSNAVQFIGQTFYRFIKSSVLTQFKMYTESKNRKKVAVLALKKNSTRHHSNQPKLKPVSESLTHSPQNYVCFFPLTSRPGSYACKPTPCHCP